MIKAKKNFGFTLVELLVVIAILGIISVVVIYSVSSAKARSRDARRLSDLSQLKLALEFYYEANNAVPVSNGVETSSGATFDINLCSDQAPSADWQSDSPVQALVNQKYISHLPTDPFNNDTYCFRYESNPDSVGACAWVLLENDDKVGIVVGEPSVDSYYNQHYPKGFDCGNVSIHGNGLDRIIGGEINGIGSPLDLASPPATPSPNPTGNPPQPPPSN